MATRSISDARNSLPAVVATAQTEAVILERYGRPAAVLISPERYDQLMDAFEEVEDATAFDEAMAEDEPNLPWAQITL